MNNLGTENREVETNSTASYYAFRCGDAEALVDPEDSEVLNELLAEGWRLELRKAPRRHIRTPALVLRGHASIALARAVMRATEGQHVVHKVGPEGVFDPLDCRKSRLELRDAGRRIGWASKINGTGPCNR
jgi:hypothetical protein